MTAAERGSARKRVGCADHRSAARCHALLCPFPSSGASVASAADRRRVPCRIKGNKGIHIMCIHTFRVRIRRYGWMHRSLVSARRCPISGYGRRSRLAPCIHTGSGGDLGLDRALQATGYTPGASLSRRRRDSADRELGAPVIGRPGGRCAWWFDRECSCLSGLCSGQRSPREAGWAREAHSADRGRPRHVVPTDSAERGSPVHLATSRGDGVVQARADELRTLTTRDVRVRARARAECRSLGMPRKLDSSSCEKNDPAPLVMNASGTGFVSGAEEVEAGSRRAELSSCCASCAQIVR